MKKTALKILSVILCLVLALSAAIPAFAAGEKTAFIVVSGMNTFPLKLADGSNAFPPSGEDTAKMVLSVTGPTLKYIIDRDYEALGNGILAPLRLYFSKLECDNNGNSVCDVVTTEIHGSMAKNGITFEDKDQDEFALVRAGIEKFGAENTFFFNYDWRLDPLDHAEKLHDFIESVKEETSCGRIALAAYSMGGTVVCSYLYKYGSADLDSIALCSTAFQGTTSLSSLFTADMDLSMDGLMKRLAQLTRNNTLEGLMEYINEILNLSGVNGALEKFANDMQLSLKKRLYDEFITPVFGHMPGLWALVDGKSYEDAKEWMLDENVNAALIKRADEYHYNVQQKADKLLKTACADTNIYLIAQYNMQGLPVSEVSSTSNNDYLIDVTYASGGAVCADLGETLGSGYVQAVDCGHNHLSADGQIDASTCMFPESTWFIRDMGHVDYPYGSGTDLIITLSASEKQLTVFSDAKYPQFLKYSYADNTLIPVEDMQETPADAVFNVLTRITVFIFKIASAIIGR